MTLMRKKEIVTQMRELITEIDEDDFDAPVTAEPSHDKVEMLTVKECTEIVQGISEHSVRRLIAQDKVKYVRTGEGKHGKFLINKDSLISYFKK